MSEPGAEAWVTTEVFRVEPALGPLRRRGRSWSLRPRQATPGHRRPGACSSSQRTFGEMLVSSHSSQLEQGFCHLQPTASSLILW